MYQLTKNTKKSRERSAFRFVSYTIRNFTSYGRMMLTLNEADIMPRAQTSELRPTNIRPNHSGPNIRRNIKTLLSSRSTIWSACSSESIGWNSIILQTPAIKTPDDIMSMRHRYQHGNILSTNMPWQHTKPQQPRMTSSLSATKRKTK
jgi:hypothetical protein